MAATVEAPEKMVGKAIKRREDPRLITGRGNFLDDVQLPVWPTRRSCARRMAHARHRAIDTSRAAAMPGVIGVFTGEDFMDLNPLPCAWQAAGVDNNVTTPRVLAVGEVHQVGDPVAVVVAEDPRHRGRRARGDRRRLRELAGGRRRRRRRRWTGAPQLHENAPNNIVMTWTCGKDADDGRAALAASPRCGSARASSTSG